MESGINSLDFQPSKMKQRASLWIEMDWNFFELLRIGQFCWVGCSRQKNLKNVKDAT